MLGDVQRQAFAEPIPEEINEEEIAHDASQLFEEPGPEYACHEVSPHRDGEGRHKHDPHVDCPDPQEC